MLEFDELLPPLLGQGNDWTLFQRAVELRFPARSKPAYTLPVSVVIPVYNRREKLGKTIAALTHSSYPLSLIEIVIADDGSSDSPESLIPLFKDFFPIKHVSQEDLGYRLSEIRNLGVREASNDCIIILDCDMLPEPTLVESFMKYMHVSKKAVLIGGRRYVNTDDLSIQDVLENIETVLNLPTQRVDTGRGPVGDEAPSEDWRYKFYHETEQAKSAQYAFRWLCGGNLCIDRQLHESVGGFDETFTAWGAEDQEYGYRLYRHGAWFIPVEGAEALHQEPPGGSNETDRESGKEITRDQLVEKCPAMYRKFEPGRVYEVPRLTVYIPAYNCVDFIQEAVDSALNQTMTDLEVIVCNDGSTDGTGELIDRLYSGNERVIILHQENKGISSASNAAIRAGRGEFILQLDGDDVLLPSAADKLLSVFLQNNSNLGFVYGDSFLIDEHGASMGPAYSWAIYSRKRLMQGMMIHHPRMFRRRDFNRSGGFDESISNAVDYDFFLKLSEITAGYHLQTPLYLYRQHKSNTSTVNKVQQDNNTIYCVNQSIARSGLDERVDVVVDETDARRFATVLRKNPTDYAVRLDHAFGRLGISSDVFPPMLRWELDALACDSTLQLSRLVLNGPIKSLVLGPYGSSRVASNVHLKLKNEFELDGTLQSKISSGKIGYYVVVQMASQNNSEAIKLSTRFRDESKWSTELMPSHELPDLIRTSKSTQQEMAKYLDGRDSGTEGDQDRYIVGDHWSTAGDLLILKWKEHEVYFQMPVDWSIDDTHPDLFQLAHHLLVEPWDKSAMEHWNPTREPGWRPGLAFSGGIDSAAAMALMPEDTVLLYNERTGISGQLDHTNAFRFFDKIRTDTGRIVHCIPSNHEELRRHQGKSAGFSTDYACAVQAILLADYFGLDSIGTGMPLENSYLFHGYKYRDFQQSWFWKHYAPMFDAIGLSLYQPVAGCSEVVNLNIVTASGWDGWAQSCLRSSRPGLVCGTCWKCFRKNTLQGLPFTMSNEITTFLQKEPLKQAASTLYSIKQGGVSKDGLKVVDEFPHLNRHLDRDWTFLEHYLPGSLEMIPEKYRTFTKNRLSNFALPMTEVDVGLLSSVNLYETTE